MGRSHGDQGIHARNLDRPGVKMAGDACLVWSKHEACFAREASHCLEVLPTRPERKGTMVAEEVISFRKDYRMSNFPVAVQFYQCGELGGTCKLTTRIIHS